VFWRWFRRKPGPLSGAPSSRRLKTYSAESGYVYEYYYEGWRACSAADGPGVEYVFEIHAGPARTLSVSVRLSEAASAAWEREHRPLATQERYAIAKLALFRVFDERAHPDLVGGEHAVSPAEVAAILETLGIE
jgi:hypothetical protein